MIPFLRQRGSAARGPAVSCRQPIEDYPYVIWNLPIEHPVLIMAVAMGVFLVAPALAERLRAPGLIGILVAGGIIGPNGLNVLAREQTIVLLGTVGLLYLFFVAGISIDLHSYRHYRNRRLTFGTVSFQIPQSSAQACS
jgi:Kef-type K+ transport system membrane component KefB